jgi:hypothetical protein
MLLAKKLVLFIPLILVLAACANSGGEFASLAEEPVFFDESEGAPARDIDTAVFVESDSAEKLFENNQFQDRLIIQSGRLEIIVEDTEETMRAINRLAAARGGWMLSSNVFESGGAKSGDISIRIPADKFAETLSDIKELALEVPSEFTETQDVTEEYVDLDARLTNLEATADRVRSFLDESRNVEEALAVNRELSRLEGEIEVIKGRMQYLSQSAAFSTLQIHVTPDELNQPLEVGGWKPQGIARSAIEALISALQGLATVVIWAGIFCLPLTVVFGIPAFLIFRNGYRRWRSRQEPKEFSGEEEE